jgi:hypothetical protein
MARPKDEVDRASPSEQNEPDMLDLAQFDSLDEAMDKAEPGDRYLDIGKRLLPFSPDGMPMNYTTLFWFSMITRSQALHGAIAREIRMSNPYAVFPLIRAFVEAVVLVNYVNDHPAYVEVLTSRPRDLPKRGPKRKSIQALISYASKHAPGLKNVYAELSEATHFGAIAMWTPHAIANEDENSMKTTWTNYPRWRSDNEALIACAQILELADAMEVLLNQFYARHIHNLMRQQSPPSR